MYTYEEALHASIKYFNGVELSAKVFVDKYALRDNDGNLMELTPEDMHRRIAKEFARIEKRKFKQPMSEEEIFGYLDKYNCIIPQGSPLYGIGNPYQTVSLSNCFVLEQPEDSYGGILRIDEQLVQISKRRGGVGISLDALRPRNSPTRNSSRTSTGILSWMDRYSNSIREVGQCIRHNQRVLTSNGLKPISDINPTEMVWTKEGWTMVENVISTGKKKIYRVTTDKGYTVETSIDHVYQTFDIDGNLTEHKLSELEAGDNIVLCIGDSSYGDKPTKLNTDIVKHSNNKPSNCKLPNHLTEELAYIIGYSYGDGYTDNNGVIRLACSNDYPEIITKLENNILNVFDYQPTKRAGDGNLQNVSIHNKTIVDFLRNNGLLKQKSKDLVFPTRVMHASLEVQAAFIAGYFDADGYASGKKKGYVFASICLPFLKEIQTLLSIMGIPTKISFEDRSSLNWNTLYSLTVVGKTAQTKFVELMRQSNKVTLSKHISKRDCWLTPFKSRSFDIKYNNYTYCPDNQQYLSLSTVERLQTDKESVNTYLLQDQIASIEYIGEDDCYDLVLESEHLFWCEGVYVHNSGRRGALMLTLNVHHPDILDFITAKDEQDKVTGANISVQYTDEFLDAVDKDEEYEQRWPINSPNPTIVRWVRARDIWEKAVHQAWKTAEPGLQFWDNTIRESVADCYSEDGFRSVTSNPCLPLSATVLTKNGVRQLKDIKVGDDIWSSEGWTKVVNWFRTGRADVFRYTTDSGTICCTSNHRVISNGQKVEIDKADYIDTVPIDDEKSSKPCKIKNKELVSYQDVYDITVDNESNTFWCNGFNVSNCSELILSELDSCRLLAINLMSCVKHPFQPYAEFDTEKFYKIAQVAQRLMDDLIDLEIEAIDRIIKKIKDDPEDKYVKQREFDMWKKIRENCVNGRRTGTGITALGDTIAACSIQYGSDDSIRFTNKIYETLKLGCYRSSVDMAKELGAFPVWDNSKELNNPFLSRFNESKIGAKILEDMNKYGRRNIALLTTAPTGTISTQASFEINGKRYFGTSSGIEPVFMTSYTRRKKGNPGDDIFRVDFVDQNGDSWMEFKVYHAGVEAFMDVKGEKEENSPYNGACAEEIDWLQRVRLQAVAQKHIDHSISSTINLPEDVSEDKVGEIYLEAWKQNLKGITVYRKNCRTGVLVEEKKGIPRTDAPKRGEELECDVYYISVQGTPYFVLVGLYNGDPYEIFAGRNNGVIDRNVKTGKIIRMYRPKGYKAELDDGTVIQPVTIACNDQEDAITRLASTGLRHGADIKFLVEQLNKTHGEMTSFSKALARALKRYIPDGESANSECPECQKDLVFQEGCKTCPNCGWAKCS